MKIQKNEFKAIIKECLKELINEGALNPILSGLLSEQSSGDVFKDQQQIPVNNQLIKAVAMQTAGGNPKQAEIMEQIFADTAVNSLPYHMRNEMPGSGANIASLSEGMVTPSYSQNTFTPPRNPLPPRELTQQQPVTAASRWANLAFNSPISNRPSSHGVGPGASGFMPGAKKGSFE